MPFLEPWQYLLSSSKVFSLPYHHIFFFNVFSCPTATTNCSLAWKAKMNLQGRCSFSAKLLIKSSKNDLEINFDPDSGTPSRKREDLVLKTSVFCWFFSIFPRIDIRFVYKSRSAILAFFRNSCQILTFYVKVTQLVFKIRRSKQSLLSRFLQKNLEKCWNKWSHGFVNVLKHN